MKPHVHRYQLFMSHEIKSYENNTMKLCIGSGSLKHYFIPLLLICGIPLLLICGYLGNDDMKFVIGISLIIRVHQNFKAAFSHLFVVLPLYLCLVDEVSIPDVLATTSFGLFYPLLRLPINCAVGSSNSLCAPLNCACRLCTTPNPAHAFILTDA